MSDRWSDRAVADPSLDLAILQYLREVGYERALAELEAESGLSASECRHPPAHLRTMAMLCHRAKARDNAALKEMQCERETTPPVQRQAQSIERLHSGANVTAVRWVGDRLLTGGADRLVCLSSPGSGGECHRLRFDASVVSLDVHEASALAVVGCMDGACALLRVGDGGLREAARWRTHTKYAHVVRWHPSGRLFASGSFDHSVHVYAQDEGGSFARARAVECAGVVEGLAWACGGERLVASVRGAGELLMYDAATMRPVSSLPLETDGGAPLVALALQSSPDGRWVSASTDRGRTLVLSVESATCVRQLIGASGPDGFGRPVHTWHPSGRFLYATAEHAEYAGPIDVWDVAAERPLHALQGHAAQVRDMHQHPSRNLLATCGFDKTVRVWSSGERPSAALEERSEAAVEELDVVAQRMEL